MSTSREKSLRGIPNILMACERRLPRNLDHILYERDKGLGWALSDVADFHKAKGIYEFFGFGRMEPLKQHFSVASKLTLAAVGMEGGPSFEVGNEIFYALLSDDAEVIDAMARLETPELANDRFNPLRSRFKVHMWQLAVLGDYASLESMIHKLAKNGHKSDRKLAAEGVDFFSLLIRGDRPGLEDFIQQHAQTKSTHPLTEAFMTYPGTMETKLCWLKGINIQIDSPLVPMALMPVKPLDYYDEVYEFLQPDWVPPAQGLMGKVSRWFRK